MNNKLNVSIKATITNFLIDQIPGLIGTYVFGSYADNTANSNSDIDIGFLTFEKISSVEKWKIQEALASKLDKDID